MEVEMQTVPSFSRMSGYSNLGAKRTRSFDEDSQSIRPMKRPSLALDRISSHLFSSQANSRQTSEDWVQQTDGLRIGTPVDSSTPSPSVEDVDMDEDPPAGSATFMPISATTLPANYHPQNTMAPASFGTVVPPCPTIAVLPPTPTLNRVASAPQMARPPSPLRDASMSMIPESSLNVVASPKKARFTMGPRSGCEKCRLGVKGHWSHFN